MLFYPKTAQLLKKTQKDPFHEPLFLSRDEQSASHHPDSNVCKSNTLRAGWGTIAPETHTDLTTLASFQGSSLDSPLPSHSLPKKKHIRTGKPQKFFLKELCDLQ